MATTSINSMSQPAGSRGSTTAGTSGRQSSLTPRSAKINPLPEGKRADTAAFRDEFRAGEKRFRYRGLRSPARFGSQRAKMVI